MKRFLCLLLILLLPCSVLAASTVTVTGTASVQVEADAIMLTLGLTTQAPTVAEATAENAAGMLRIHEALAADGVEEADRVTANYDISTVYDWSENTERLIGYRVTHMLHITVHDIALAGKIIDHAALAGANAVYSVSYVCTDTAEAYDQAMTAAVQEAARKAAVMAQAMDKQVTGVVSVHENSGSYAGINYREVPDAEEAAFSMAKNGSTAFSGGTLSVSATVSAVFEIE